MSFIIFKSNRGFNNFIRGFNFHLFFEIYQKKLFTFLFILEKTLSSFALRFIYDEKKKFKKSSSFRMGSHLMASLEQTTSIVMTKPKFI